RRPDSPAPIEFLEADTQRLPFAGDQFQLTVVAFGLRNVTDTDRGLAEMVRVTQPGGRVAILEFSRPRHWFFGRMYQAYFRYVLPFVGQFISRSKDNAYRYLPASVREFPDGEALAERLRSHGLTDVRWHPLTFGIATLYVGRKAGARDCPSPGGDDEMFQPPPGRCTGDLQALLPGPLSGLPDRRGRRSELPGHLRGPGCSPGCRDSGPPANPPADRHGNP